MGCAGLGGLWATCRDSCPEGSWGLRLELWGEVWLQTKVWAVATCWDHGGGRFAWSPHPQANAEMKVQVQVLGGDPRQDSKGWGREPRTVALLSGLLLWEARAQPYGQPSEKPWGAHLSCPKEAEEAGYLSTNYHPSLVGAISGTVTP